METIGFRTFMGKCDEKGHHGFLTVLPASGHRHGLEKSMWIDGDFEALLLEPGLFLAGKEAKREQHITNWVSPRVFFLPFLSFSSQS